MNKIVFPKNNFLRVWLLWSIFKCLAKPFYDFVVPASSWIDQLFYFVMGQLTSFLYGSVWSDFWLISYGSIVLHLYLIANIVFPDEFNSDKALNKKIISFLFALSLFTIWAEPYVSVQQLPITLYLGPALAFLILFDIAFTLLRFVLHPILLNSLQKERDAGEVKQELLGDAKSTSILAGLMSFVLAGAGQIYLGQTKKGITLICVSLALRYISSPEISNLVVPSPNRLIMLASGIFWATDAFMLARQSQNQKPKIWALGVSKIAAILYGAFVFILLLT